MTTYYGNEALSTLTNNAPDFEEMDEGCTNQYNHADCPSGTDTRGRLSITRVDGAYLWHCYNCGDSGYYRDRETVERIKKETKEVAPTKKYVSYYDLTKTMNYDMFKVEGQLWLGQYEFDRGMCTEYQIAESQDGIVLPIYNNRAITGYQVRRYSGSPKYLSYISNRFSFINNPSSIFNEVPLVIVEDLLSSYKLNYAGYPTLCLLGTKLDVEAVEILRRYRDKRVLVWLDDDVAGHNAAIALMKELSVVVPNITSMVNLQPKEMMLSELKEMEL